MKEKQRNLHEKLLLDIKNKNMYVKIAFIGAMVFFFTENLAIFQRNCPVQEGIISEQNRLSPVASPKLRVKINLCGDDSNVYALANGYIRKVISNKSHYTIYLQNDKGIEHRITNLNKITVKEGARVSTESILGSVDTKEPNNFILYSIWRGDTELRTRDIIQCNCKN